ncbi:MAG: hypothetical protein ACREK2_04300 [Gemmatimonadota bacterium]
MGALDRRLAAVWFADMVGRVDEALRDLGTARDERDWFLVRAAVAPQCDPLRSDPRFAEFLASIGLSDIPLPAEQSTR